ncbi:MAG: ubiquinone/menaquinone biosynthesis methyltransferase, partial [Bacteroidota bacterium]
MEFSHDNVKPYEEGTNSKKAEVAKMFDNIAPKYDLLNRVLSLGIDKLWRKKAIKLLGTDQPKQVLDVATGTADVAIEIARQLPDAQITGVDISKEMLAFGDEKLEKLNLTDQINLKLGDSEKLGFEDNTFDAVSVAFGVRNFENLVQGITEIHRVLKPGSKVVILEFSKPRIFPFRQIYNGYFKYILPA